MKSEKDMMGVRKKEIVVQDACILIDLIELELIEEFFQLEFSVFTTFQVVNEITNIEQKARISIFLENGQLQIDKEGTVEDIFTLSENHPALSIADSSVLELALRKDAIIFSSDGSLRKISIRKELTIRGSLWIIEELYTQEFISVRLAIEKLNLYQTINKRAPIKQIRHLINKLNNLK